MSLIFLLLTNSFFAQQANDDLKSGLTFEQEEIDYGKIPHSSDGERVFKFTNTGDEVIVISNVKTSCGCTVPSFPKEPILPGQTGEITVKYDTKRIGSFSKTLSVISNASNPTQTLKIKGEVLKNPS
ncbi:MAG: DUF1573 domain-containing protein [Flavobacteriaceae bacterium]|nr:DUF1573 domain-containing protein [Flavobacteriaceae bacterium]